MFTDLIIRLSKKDDYSQTYDLKFRLEKNSFIPKWHTNETSHLIN